MANKYDLHYVTFLPAEDAYGCGLLEGQQHLDETEVRRLLHSVIKTDQDCLHCQLHGGFSV